MSGDEPPPDGLSSARHAVDAATEALVLASRKRVPSRELAEARRRLKIAEEQLDRARTLLRRETGSFGAPEAPDAPSRRKPRD